MRKFIDILKEFSDNPVKTTGSPPRAPTVAGGDGGGRLTWHYLPGGGEATSNAVVDLGCTHEMPFVAHESDMAFVLVSAERRLVALAVCSHDAPYGNPHTKWLNEEEGFGLYWECEGGSHPPFMSHYMEDLYRRIKPAVDKYFQVMDDSGYYELDTRDDARKNHLARELSPSQFLDGF